MAYATGLGFHDGSINDAFGNSTTSYNASRFYNDGFSSLNNGTRNKHIRSTHPAKSLFTQQPVPSRLKSPLQSPSTAGLSKQSQIRLETGTRNSQREERQMNPKEMNDTLFARYKQVFSDGFRKIKAGSHGVSLDSLSERIPMSLNQFQELDQILNPDENESDARYPSLSYDAKLSIGIIQWMPSAVHEVLIRHIDEEIGAVKRTLSDTTLKESLINSGSTRIESFTDEYKDTTKEPDSSFMNIDRLVSVIEIGFSERYDHMIANVNLWLNQAQIVILICANEDPPWTDPIKDWDNKKRLEFLSEHQTAILPKDFISEISDDPFSALMFDGKRWFNKLGEVFVEKWKRDHITGVPEQDGKRTWVIGGHDQHDTPFECTLSEIYDITPEDGGSEKVVLTNKAMRRVVHRAISIDAARRLNNKLRMIRMRIEDEDDEDDEDEDDEDDEDEDEDECQPPNTISDISDATQGNDHADSEH